MKRTIIASLFLIIACKEEKKEIKTQQIQEKVVLHNESNEAEEAQKWLKTSIVDYF